MIKKNTFQNFFNIFLIFLSFTTIIKPQSDSSELVVEVPQLYEIHVVFEGEGLKTIFCDDNIEIYDKGNINFYTVDEENNKININSLINKYSEEGLSCQYQIKYNVTLPKEKIIIEIIGNSKKLKQLFADSQISRLERFDYPFPENENDMNGMFYHCTSLTYVNLLNFNFSKVIDVSKMFYSCTNLKEIIFPEGNSDNIEDFSDFIAFSTNIEKVDLSNFTFTNAKNLGYMFNGCTNLKEVIFPKKKAEKIETTSDMFAYCKNLISLDLSYLSFKKARNIAYMFNGCKNLTTLKLPTDEKATDIQHIRYMFSGCYNLTSIDLSAFSFVNIIDISSIFSNCEKLETLILPNNEMASNIQDYSYMFQGCLQLKEIDLSNIDFVNAKKLLHMFYECKNLKHIDFYTSEKATKIESIQMMFLYCENLISIDLSNFSFTKVKSLSAMFLYCSNLETVILPKDEITSSVEDISYMFAICFKLKTINLSGISFKNVKDMSFIFSNCINLETIIFPEDVEISSNIQFFSYVFANCHKLKTIDISKFNLNKVQDISYLFFSCINLENIKLPTRKLNNIISMEHTFDNCSKIEFLDLTPINMSKVSNLNYAFSNCKDLLKIKFTEDEKINVVNEMNNIFANCISLTSLNLSNFYIYKNVDLNQTFVNCNSLKEINIWNMKTAESSSTYKFLYGAPLEGCLYYSNDIINLGDSTTNRKCSKYIGFHKCGPCLNSNNDEYCIMNIDGENFNFYYLEYELDLPVSERQCYWSHNYENAVGFMFLDNSNKNRISYYIDYCEHFCDECSDDRYGCVKCKNNLYPIDIEYNDYINIIKSYFFCYNSNDMKNYYLDPEIEAFIKCSEKCAECSNGVDLCDKCNNEKEYFKVEGNDYECWKTPPAENWILDEKAKEWRKCNDRCKKCKYQSNSDIDHQCIKCADNYYPYYIDFLNYEKGARNTFNCYTNDEVKLENANYYLNGDYYEKCDESCAECENKKDNCLKCQMNYYPISNSFNGTCFHYPLEGYSIIQINGETVYQACYHLCKFCNQISQSFFYQQCSECDEINNTLDLYSLNQSYCIPLIKTNNIYFVNEGQKWYIPDFTGMEKFIFEDKLYTIDYQRLLQGEKYKNFNYKIVDECPEDKPYIIYTTRQCVSSCSSPNLIEFGIFMTKKLYSYKNICYNKCPHGSINDDNDNTCKEINEYTKNISLTMKTYTTSIKDYILRYLGDEYARETVQFTRGEEFSAYDLKIENMNDIDKIEKMKDYKIPIYIFPECIAELRKNYSLNESENIYIEIIENNNEKSGLNSTIFKFFTDNGDILDHSCCNNLNMTVMKYINVDKIGINDSIIEMMNYLLNNSIGISDPEFLDHCKPLIMNGSDFTIKDRQLLANKAKLLCDNNCDFVNFDFIKNYSVCICKMSEEGNTISEELLKQFEDLELIEKIKKFFDSEGNWKYYFCYKIFKQPEVIKKNWIIYLHIIFLSTELVFFSIYFCKYFNKIRNIYINIIRNLNINNIEVFIYNNENNINNNQIEIDDEITENYFQAQNENISFKLTLWKYIKEKILFFSLFIKNNNFEPFIFKLIKLIIFIENYYYISTFLFTDKYISSIKYWKEKKYEYTFTSEFNRNVYIIILCIVLNTIIFLFFDGLNRLKEAINAHKNENLNDEKFKIRVIYLKNIFFIKFIIGFIVVIILHIVYLYFFIIFGTLFYNSQKYVLILFFSSITGYFILYFLIILIAMILRFISLEFRYQIFEYIFKLSIFIADHL